MTENFKRKHCFLNVKDHVNDLPFLMKTYISIYGSKLPDSITILPYKFENLTFTKVKAFGAKNGDVCMVANEINVYLYRPYDKKITKLFGNVYAIRETRGKGKTKTELITHLIGIEYIDKQNIKRSNETIRAILKN